MTAAACLHPGMIIDPLPMFGPERRTVVATAEITHVRFDLFGNAVYLAVEILSVFSPDAPVRLVSRWRVVRRNLDPTTEFTVYEPAALEAS